MGIFKTIIASTIAGLTVLAITGFLSWDYADKWDYVNKMRDYINETIDILIFIPIVFIVGVVVGMLLKIPKWILRFFQRQEKTDPNLQDEPRNDGKKPDIDIDESVEIDYKDINSLFGNSNITNHGNITINMPPTTKETNKPDKQEDKK